MFFVDLIHTVPKSSSTTMVNCSPQRQQNLLIVSQPNSSELIVSDTHTTTSPVVTLNVVQSLTTSSSVITFTGQNDSVITTAGV